MHMALRKTGRRFLIFPLRPQRGNCRTYKQHIKQKTIELTRPLNILFAEDNRVNQVLAEEVISSYGRTINGADNDKVPIKANQSNSYDLILMDVRMLEIDGIEAAQFIRRLDSHKANIPIIAVTADALKDNIDSCLESGINTCCNKLFDWSNLQQTINHVLKEDIHQFVENHNF